MVPPLSDEDAPAEAGALKDEPAAMLPFTPIASLLIELDARTHSLDCFTHSGGRRLTKTAETKRNILAVLIATATNLGLARMSRPAGVTLVRDDTPTEIAKRYPHAGPWLGARWNEDLIANCWPDLLGPGLPQEDLPPFEQGGSLHGLCRDLHYAQQGTVTRPHLEQKTEQAWCLTLLTNSVVAWTTEYYSREVLELRSQGREAGDVADLSRPQ
ncbi:Tn3 family transposase [Microtetraspora sp. NBRC 13810]|uniref:Tn3 family transposase n=1 Tax=Microtetraspora sp. NBRC 13810 TaxID=3030990 RepID=UPI002554CEC5|nr:Tn3 family transposase [Microtetraspora sp. NBRC 13810]